MNSIDFSSEHVYYILKVYIITNNLIGVRPDLKRYSDFKKEAIFGTFSIEI